MDPVSLVVGAFISAAVGCVFWWLGGRDLRKATEDLKAQNELLRKSVNTLVMIAESRGAKVHRDADGNPTAVVHEGRGAASIGQFDVSGSGSFARSTPEA